MDNLILNNCCGNFSLRTGSFWNMLIIMGCSIAALVFSRYEFERIVNPQELVLQDLIAVGEGNKPGQAYSNVQLFAGICLAFVIIASICGLHAVFKGQRDYLYPPLIVYPLALLVLLFFTFKVPSNHETIYSCCQYESVSGVTCGLSNLMWLHRCWLDDSVYLVSDLQLF